VVYGHTPVPKPEWVNNTICIDTGVVFGGSLTALRWPSRELVSVPAERVWYAPVRPLAERPGPAQPIGDRADTAQPVEDPPDPARPLDDPHPPHHAGRERPGRPRPETAGLLRVADVTGRRWIDTGYGRVLVPAENAAA